MRPELERWKRQRARLSHDLVKNRSLPAIHTIVRILEGSASGAEPAALTVEALEELKPVYVEAERLAVTGLELLDPARVVESDAFRSVTPEVRAWLCHAVSGLRQARCQESRTWNDVLSRTAKVRNTMLEVYGVLAEIDGPETHRRALLLPVVMKLKTCVRDLSEALSCMPADPEVV
jgi:hypothetical protein